MKKAVQIGRLSVEEIQEIQKAKYKYIHNYALGEHISDRMFFMGLIKRFMKGEW